MNLESIPLSSKFVSYFFLQISFVYFGWFVLLNRLSLLSRKARAISIINIKIQDFKWSNCKTQVCYCLYCFPRNLLLAFVLRVFQKEYVIGSIYSLSGCRFLNYSICILFQSFHRVYYSIYFGNNTISIKQLFFFIYTIYIWFCNFFSSSRKNFFGLMSVIKVLFGQVKMVVIY